MAGVRKVKTTLLSEISLAQTFLNIVIVLGFYPR
ncbi:hypothetical protein ACP0HM_19045 [Escherichia coli]